MPTSRINADPRFNLSKRLAIIIVSSAGGVGKTTLAQMLEATATLAQVGLQIVDADPANAGYSIETRDPRATKLRSIIDMDGTGVGGYIEQLNISGTQVVIVDGGAAMTAMDSSIVDGFRDLCELLAAAGFSLVSFLPIASSKGQSSRQIEVLAQRLSRLGQVLLACTDSAGTGHYPHWLGSMAAPRLIVPRVAPGFVDLRRRFVMPLSSFLDLTDPELSVCQATYARGCLELATQPPISNATSHWKCTALHELSQRAIILQGISPINASEALASVLEHRIAYGKANAEMFRNAREDPSHPCYALVLQFDKWMAAKADATEKLGLGSAK